MSLEPQLIIVLLLSYSKQLVAQLERSTTFSAAHMKQPQPRHDLEALAAVAEITAKFFSATVGLRRLGR